MSKERSPVRQAFDAYRSAVVEESRAREAHEWRAHGPRAPTADTLRDLIAAIGRLGEARAALDHAILDAHGLTAAAAVTTG